MSSHAGKSDSEVGSLTPPRPFSRMRKRRRLSSGLQGSRSVAKAKLANLFTVRPNPPHYVLDMSVKSVSTERVVADAFVKNGIRCVSVYGLPGSGKTVILRAVAYDLEIHKTFRDGVSLIGLRDASPQKFLTDLCEVVGKICGVSVQVKIESEISKPNSHLAVITAIAKALAGRKVMLLLDAVGAIGSGVYELVSALAKIAIKEQDTFAVLVSSRSMAVAKALAERKAAYPVKLSDSCGSQARNIICAHAGFTRREFDEACEVKDNSILPVLQKCSGLPLALAVAGGAVKRLLVSVPNQQTRMIIWAHYRRYLCNNFNQFGYVSGLFHAFGSCAEIIADSKNWPKGIKVPEALCWLRTMKGDVWIPITTFEKVWNLKSREDTVAAIDCLAQACLLSRNIKGDEFFVKIPAIVVDYCRSLVGKLEKAVGNGNVLSSADASKSTVNGKNGHARVGYEKKEASQKSGV